MPAIGSGHKVTGVAELGNRVVEAIRLPGGYEVGRGQDAGLRLPLHAEGRILAEQVDRWSSSSGDSPAPVVEGEVPERRVPEWRQAAHRLRTGGIVFQLEQVGPPAVVVEGEQMAVVAADRNGFQVPEA
ncbi:MAG: hypothetical protein F4Z21_12060, partial [Acidobacteria bacterium]|nr:hypothetical protein [Acidobacteriota bacterium]